MRLDRRIPSLPLPLLLALGATACVTMSAGSDYYRGADFSGYRTFSWISDMPLVSSASTRVQVSQLDIRRIRESIERELAAKGFTEVPNREDADFSLSFTVGARDAIRVEDYPQFYRGRWRWGPPYYWPNVDIYMYTEGTLAIDVFDNESREPVWHGWARKQIVGRDIRDPERSIRNAVAAILEDFPPE